MRFGVYLALVTLAVLALRWVLFELFERTRDGPSFLLFMLDPNAYPQDPRIRAVTALAFVAAIGLWWIFGQS